jgi:hypothetical protein
MSPTNFYFQSGNTSGTTNEQRLLEDLIIESIQIHGHDVYYLPRRSIDQDNILGEDVLSRFENAYPIEMYLTNIEGWEGDGELFSKFGLQVTHQATFVVSKRRWEDVIGNNPDELLQLPLRPAEGDIIYFPKTNSMFEIKFVQHLNPFYQLGKFYIYSMNCELYQYSSEILNTGVEEIDKMQGISSQNLFDYQLLLESGDLLLTTTGYSVVLEKYNTREQVPFSDNQDFETQGKTILDFTAINPFGEY